MTALLAELRAHRATVTDAEVDAAEEAAFGYIDSLDDPSATFTRSAAAKEAVESLAALARRNSREAAAYRSLTEKLRPMVEAYTSICGWGSPRAIGEQACLLADAYIAAVGEEPKL